MDTLGQHCICSFVLYFLYKQASTGMLIGLASLLWHLKPAPTIRTKGTYVINGSMYVDPRLRRTRGVWILACRRENSVMSPPTPTTHRTNKRSAYRHHPCTCVLCRVNRRRHSPAARKCNHRRRGSPTATCKAGKSAPYALPGHVSVFASYIRCLFTGVD